MLLVVALKNFARPIAWSKNLWELDTSDENNGLQVSAKI